MNYLSVCSGIESASVAWEPLGWNPVAFSEIEAFPRAVLKHRFPGVQLFGDFTKIHDKITKPIDLLVGGTPCQSFSIAGLRGGLDDDRGNLALEYCRLAQRKSPRWLVWENVPGALSSNEGRDFGSILGAMAELGYGFAYRVLDAQYVRVESHARAVPQRRRRVFVVGYLGDWRRAAAVLSELESLQGHSPPRREAGKVAAGTFSSRTTGGGGFGTDFECQGGLIPQPFSVANCMTRRMHKGINSTVDEGQTPVVAFDTTQVTNPTNRSRPTIEHCHTLTSGQHPPAVCYRGVRRLTPLECERLQGFPDGWTEVPYRGKPAADSPRYKAIGNSMAVNVMRWIGERIKLVDSISQDG